jgi:hypothetical protein
MAKLWVGRGVGHRGAAPLMPPRWLGVFPVAWWALGGWLTGSPVGYGLTGSVAGGPEPRVRGRSTAAGLGGGAVLWGASVAPSPLFPPVEPTPAASAESHEHNHLSAPAIRERIVLLPHAPIEPTDTRTQNRCTPEMTTGINYKWRRFPAAISDPADSRQCTANLGQRATSFSPPDAAPAVLSQTSPCTSASCESCGSAVSAESVMTSCSERRAALRQGGLRRWSARRSTSPDASVRDREASPRTAHNPKVDRSEARMPAPNVYNWAQPATWRLA